VVFRTGELAASRSFGLANLFMLVFVPFVAVAGLTAAAALGVGARRQLRELGLLAAAGGSGRHLRLLVLLQGFGLGLLGGLAGIPLGLAVTWAAFPWLRTLVSPVQDETGALVVPRFSVVGRDMAWTVAFTVVLALLAALRPAVTAGRVPVVAALAGRRPPRRLRPWLVAAGLVVALAGLVLQGVANQLDARGVIIPVQLELLALGSFGSIPSPLLITLASPESSGWLVRSQAGFYELEPEATPAFPPALRVLLAIFTVMAVAVVLAVNALGRVEARDDLAVLEALGASPRTRRALATASAWLVTELGALLGAAAGLSPLLVQRAVRSLPTPYPMGVPWLTLALVVLAVPAVAAAAAALTAGGSSPPPAERRPA
jgi:ABC-type lipoprotein release transport system permease subunit